MREPDDYAVLCLVGAHAAPDIIKTTLLGSALPSAFKLLTEFGTLRCRSHVSPKGAACPRGGKLSEQRLTQWASALAECESFGFELYDSWSSAHAPNLYAACGLTSYVSFDPYHYVTIAARDALMPASFERLKTLARHVVAKVPVAYGILDRGIGWDRPMKGCPSIREYLIDVRHHDLLLPFAKAKRSMLDAVPWLHDGNILTARHFGQPIDTLPPTLASRLDRWNDHVYLELESNADEAERLLALLNTFSVPDAWS